MKESGGDITKIGMIMAATKNNHLNFCVIAGSTTFLLPASQVGSNGAVCGLGNMIPEECCRLQELIGMPFNIPQRLLGFRLHTCNSNLQNFKMYSSYVAWQQN